jgi:hypothetical protein
MNEGDDRKTQKFGDTKMSYDVLSSVVPVSKIRRTEQHISSYVKP